MKRALKLSIVGAAIAGAAVGTVAFLRSRKGADKAELLDYDETASTVSDSVSDTVSSATDAASDAAADLKAAASEVVDS